PLIHISTDFVFDGKKKTPYIETDKTNPLSVYAKTKLDGEEAIIKQNGTYIIIRTSWLYSEYGNNFVKTIIKHAKEKNELRVVNDQIGSPTYAEDLADVILQIIPRIKKGTREIFHYSNEGIASWYDFAVKIIELKKLNCKIIPIEAKDYPTAAQRPEYSVMDKSKIKDFFDIKMYDWQSSLKKCISKLGSNI
ncbi:MAG: sugar nucleotide-binding protein, partial [bacterium]